MTHSKLVVICTKSIWLAHLDISGCKGIKGDVEPLKLLLALRVFRARNCKELAGAAGGGV